MDTKLNLNENQVQAVNHLNGPAIVIAGPGSGKTRVITSRVYKLIKYANILPESIVVITFTRASAADMKNRFKNEFKDIGDVIFSTIHALIYKIMKDEKWFGPQYILNNYNSEADIDFDRLLDDAFYNLSENPKILNKYQDQYKYILIDEFQDTSHREYRLVRLLADKYNNIFVVGDDDQSIYGFRNGNSKIMQTFIAEYNPVKYYLCQNYRCAGKIVKLSMNLISNNISRLDKEIMSMNASAAAVRRIYMDDKYEQAEYILKVIQNNYATGISYSEHAILLRNHFEFYVYKNIFDKNDIPYGENGVTITTMHGSKGLEFECVFIPYLNEGIIPSNKVKNPKELEEERRLMYVAMTRAKTQLFLLSVRYYDGNQMSETRFIHEMKNQYS